MSDIEGNNLLYQLTKFHCGVTLNPFTLEERVYGPEKARLYLKNLDKHRVVVGHNFKGYDILALRKLFDYNFCGFCFDTLVLSRLLNPERQMHSLEGWGYQLKFHKGDFGKLNDWDEFSQPMLDYCVQDVRLNAVLFLYFIVRLGWYDWFGVTKEECERCALAIRKGDVKRM